jgi:hypothetical protein
MIEDFLNKLTRVQRYFTIALGAPLWVLILCGLGFVIGGVGAVSWIVLSLGFLLAEAWA